MLDGAMGTEIQGLAARRGRLSRDSLCRLAERPARQQRHPDPVAARCGARASSRLLPRRRRHRLHQYVLVDEDRPGRLRRAGPGRRAQRHRSAPRQGGRRRRRARGRTAALRRRRHRSHQPHRLDLARRRQSRLPRHHLRRIARGLWRAGQGPARGRRRPAAARDGVRHPQRQGGALRHRGAVRGARRLGPGHDIRHHHRPVGPHAVGPDAGGVLEFGAPCRAVLDRAQLRARRQGNARPYRRSRPRRRYPGLRLSQCRPAQRVRPL